MASGSDGAAMDPVVRVHQRSQPRRRHRGDGRWRARVRSSGEDRRRGSRWDRLLLRTSAAGPMGARANSAAVRRAGATRLYRGCQQGQTCAAGAQRWTLRRVHRPALSVPGRRQARLLRKGRGRCSPDHGLGGVASAIPPKCRCAPVDPTLTSRGAARPLPRLGAPGQGRLPGPAVVRSRTCPCLRARASRFVLVDHGDLIFARLKLARFRRLWRCQVAHNPPGYDPTLAAVIEVFMHRGGCGGPRRSRPTRPASSEAATWQP